MKVKIKPYTFVFQDRSFISFEDMESPLFDVEQRGDTLILRAPGYGGSPYGNGAILIKKDSFYQNVMVIDENI